MSTSTLTALTMETVASPFAASWNVIRIRDGVPAGQLVILPLGFGQHFPSFAAACHFRVAARAERVVVVSMQHFVCFGESFGGHSGLQTRKPPRSVTQVLQTVSQHFPSMEQHTDVAGSRHSRNKGCSPLVSLQHSVSCFRFFGGAWGCRYVC